MVTKGLTRQAPSLMSFRKLHIKGQDSGLQGVFYQINFKGTTTDNNAQK